MSALARTVARACAWDQLACRLTPRSTDLPRRALQACAHQALGCRARSHAQARAIQKAGSLLRHPPVPAAPVHTQTPQSRGASTTQQASKRRIFHPPAFESARGIHARGVIPSTKDALARYSKYPQNPQTMKALVDFGKDGDLQLSTTFLSNEAAIRLAHMITEIRTLPPEYLEKSNLKRIHTWYMASFADLVELGQLSPDEQTVTGTQVFQRILHRHDAVVMTMAWGLQDLRREGTLPPSDYHRVTKFLDRFYMSRIAIRFLFNQHIAAFVSLRESEITTPGGKGSHYSSTTGMVGAIEEDCAVETIAEDAARAASVLCQEIYGDCPKVNIVCPPSKSETESRFTYVPSHIFHVLFELLKNSLRAVSEFHEELLVLPEVTVIIMRGDDDLTIKISDEGGGIPHGDKHNLFSYFYSTAHRISESEAAATDMNNAPLAGFGYGLPMSRLYANYFGGDLNVMSVQGYGTDAYVHLPSCPSEAAEVLPAATHDELQYTKIKSVSDWLKRRA